MADIENIAVSAVTAVIAGADYLKSYIASGDKGPSFDGYICGFTKKGYSKKNEKGRAPVQIKGRESTAADLLQKKISYSVEVADMKAFKRECGAIFFVVLFDKEDSSHTKIFYKSLLPYDINEILKDRKEQETATIYLKPFPKGKEMEDVVLTFIEDRLKQSSIISQDRFKNYSIEEILSKKTLKDPISFNVGYTSIQSSERDSGFEYFFSHDFFIYLKGDFDTLIPMQHVQYLDMIHTERDCSFCVGNTEYFDKCSVTILKDRTVFGFYSTKTNLSTDDAGAKPPTNVVIQSVDGTAEEDRKDQTSGKAVVNDDISQKCPFVIELFHETDELGRSRTNFTYHLWGNLLEKINTARFIFALIKKRGYKLNGHYERWNPSEDELKKFKLKEMADSLKLWEDIERALEMVGCHDVLSFENFSDADERRLQCFKESVLHRRTITFPNPVPEISVYPIGNLQLMLFFEKQKDESYLIKTIPDKEFTCCTEDDKGKVYATSLYTLFGPDNYAKLSNLDLDSCVESLTAFENTVHFERANMALLNMLTAYDKSGKEELLGAAMKIATWLVGEKAPDTTISLMNFYQCLERKGQFGDDERNSVKELMKDQENPEILAGCYLLLDDNENAARELRKLDKDKKEFFLKYPIMKFMDEELKKDL